jgi:small-conductance mechanosensitive channel
LQVAAPAGADIGVVELISLGYTTLRTGDGRLIVLPNSVAASQVSVNLSQSAAQGQFTINLRVNRNTDLDAARRLATEAAREQTGEKGVVGCFLTKVDGSGATLELRLAAADPAGRDVLRSTLMARIAERFADASWGANLS